MKVEAEQLPPDMAKPSEAVDPHEEHGVGRLRCQVVLMDEIGMECFMYMECMYVCVCFCVLGSILNGFSPTHTYAEIWQSSRYPKLYPTEIV